MRHERGRCVGRPAAKAGGVGNALLYGYDQLLVCRAAELPRKGPHGFGRDIVFRCDIERLDSA